MHFQVISRTSELLESSAEQKKSCEAALEQRQRQITKLDTAFKSASQEVMKVGICRVCRKNMPWHSIVLSDSYYYVHSISWKFMLASLALQSLMLMYFLLVVI